MALLLIFLWFVVVSFLTGVYLYVRDIGKVGTTIYCILVIIQTIWWILIFIQDSFRLLGDVGVLVMICFISIESIYTLLLFVLIRCCEATLPNKSERESLENLIKRSLVDKITSRLNISEKMFKIIIPLAIIGILGAMGVKKITDKMNKFEWLPAITAPEMYPMELYQGDLFFPDGGGVSLRGGSFVDDGWGEFSAISVTGDDFKPIPNALGLTWFSFTENKFYKGYFDLPYDTMLALFKEGFILQDQKRHGTYLNILVGMAPGGVVIVWLYGDGKTVEVGRYQAEETTMTMKEFLPNTSIWFNWEDQVAAQKDYAERNIKRHPEILANLQKRGIPYGLWDTFRERFTTRVVMNYKDPNAITDEIKIKYWNGEQETLSLEALTTNEYVPRPRPKRLEIDWSSGREMRNSEIMIDEEEIQKAYKLIFDNKEQEKADLRIDVNPSNKHIRIWLSAVGTQYPKEIELLKTDIKIYPVEERLRRYFTVFKDEYEDKYPWNRKDGKKY